MGPYPDPLLKTPNKKQWFFKILYLRYEVYLVDIHDLHRVEVVMGKNIIFLMKAYFLDYVSAMDNFYNLVVPN